MSVEEYRKLEESATVRHEYVAGEIYGSTSVEWTDFHYAATPSLIVPSSYSAGLL
ncbi:MAG: hypothetical protein H0V53_09070 [Rubrobacter sp.]|nr:hypothetical protein [Rubrobacter sp.]